MNIIDITVLLIIVIVALISAKKGFLSSLFNIFAFAVSGIAAKLFSEPVADYIYEKFLHDRIISELYEIMPGGSMEAELYEIVENVMASLPDFFVSVAEQFGLYPELSAIQQSSKYTVEMIEETYISAILGNVLNVVVLVVMFILLSLFLRAVFSFINNALTKEKHNAIRKTNMFFGAAFGVIKGIVPAGVICAVLNIAAPVIGNKTLLDYVTGSYFCNLIADLIK